MNQIKKCCRKFFGWDSLENIDEAIITNIKPIYDDIIDQSEVVKQNQGFYINSIIKFNNKKYLIIKVNPGNGIIDVIKILKSYIIKINLVGLAGSLREDSQLGELICPSKVKISSDLQELICINEQEESKGTICQTDGLIYNKEFYLNLIKKGVDFVDMESYYLTSLCNEYNLKCKVISIISDNPIDNPFYCVDKFFRIDIKKLKYYLDI